MKQKSKTYLILIWAHALGYFLLVFALPLRAELVNGRENKSVQCEAQPECKSPAELEAQKLACQLRITKCKLKIDSLPEKHVLMNHLIDCEKQSFCNVTDISEAVQGCKSIVPEKYEAIAKALTVKRQKLSASVQSCSQNKASVSLKDPQFRACLINLLPDFHFPSLTQMVHYLGGKLSSSYSWSEQMLNEIGATVESKCGKKLNNEVGDKSNLRCQFEIGFNSLLDRMQTPFEKMGFKESSDLLVDTLINRQIEHRELEGCFNSTGTGLEYCLYLAGVTAGVIKSTVEIVDYLPNPKNAEAKILEAGDEIAQAQKEERRLANLNLAPTNAFLLHTEHYREHVYEGDPYVGLHGYIKVTDKIESVQSDFIKNSPLSNSNIVEYAKQIKNATPAERFKAFKEMCFAAGNDIPSFCKKAAREICEKLFAKASPQFIECSKNPKVIAEQLEGFQKNNPNDAEKALLWTLTQLIDNESKKRLPALAEYMRLKSVFSKEAKLTSLEYIKFKDKIYLDLHKNCSSVNKQEVDICNEFVRFLCAENLTKFNQQCQSAMLTCINKKNCSESKTICAQLKNKSERCTPELEGQVLMDANDEFLRRQVGDAWLNSENRKRLFKQTTLWSNKDYDYFEKNIANRIMPNSNYLASWPKIVDRASQLGNGVQIKLRNQQTHKFWLYEVKYTDENNKTFNVLVGVCVEPPCSSPGGRAMTKKGEVLSISPLCGPGIFSLPKFPDILNSEERGVTQHKENLCLEK